MVNSIIAGNNEECRYLNYFLKISTIFMQNISLIIYSGLMSHQGYLFAFGKFKLKSKGYLRFLR